MFLLKLLTILSSSFEKSGSNEKPGFNNKKSLIKIKLLLFSKKSFKLFLSSIFK